MMSMVSASMDLRISRLSPGVYFAFGGGGGGGGAGCLTTFTGELSPCFRTLSFLPSCVIGSGCGSLAFILLSF